MAIRDEDVLEINDPPMNRLESIFLPEAFKGFGTTLRHFFTSPGHGQALRTVRCSIRFCGVALSTSRCT